MIKKFFTYPVFLVLFICFIGAMAVGAIVKYHYTGGTKYQFLRSKVILFASLPMNLKNMIEQNSINVDRPEIMTRHKEKERFKRFIQNDRDLLLILPRYDHAEKRALVEIIDINNFKVLHTYKHDISEMNKLVKNYKQFPRIDIDDSPIRFEYRHPLILNDGSLVSDSDYSIEFKINFCSEIEWINDEAVFHHSKMLDSEGNIWIPGYMMEKSKFVKKYLNKKYIKDFRDDSILKINKDGKIIYSKSVIDILAENDLIDLNIFRKSDIAPIPMDVDPIHLNDIEPAFSDTKYWKKGDIFLSLRHRSSIVHYRPNENKVINYITGPFSQQHDIDIISDSEISIFNNNQFLNTKTNSEVLIYNFEKNKFQKLFNNQLKKEEFKTDTQGLSHKLKDGSLIVEEQNYGRLMLFNNNGIKEWEFVNKDKNGNIGFISWSRVIENEELINKLKVLIKDKKCLD